MIKTKIFSKLRECGKKRTELRQFCSENILQILAYLPTQILESDGDLNYLFTGLLDPQYKIKVVDIVLQVLRNKSTSLSHCGNIISRVCLELARLPAAAVVRWCNDSVQSIIDDNDVNMIWRDVVPECLNVVTALDSVKCGDTTMSGGEYKSQCLQKLLACHWKEGQLVQLTALLMDLQLSRKYHREFVIKICSFIRDMPPMSLPPLVHHLLKLCKSFNMEVVLAHLSHYFNLRLYSKLTALTQDSESTTMDVDDIEQFSEAELHGCLSTCMYHMTEGAGDPESLLRHIKAWPRSQLVREPFAMALALAMVSKGGKFKSECLDVLRLAVEQAVMDEIKRRDSAWCRAVLPSDLNIAELLKELTTGGGNDRQKTWLGLIYLGFALLGAGRGVEAHGTATLAQLAKAHPYTAPHMLAMLGDRLAADTVHDQYVECLRVLCKTAPLSVEPCAALGGILERCAPAPGAAAVFAAVRPLLGFSTRLRDTLVMVCRKGLYSRDSGHRRLAASGVLTVLRHLRVSGASGSQESEELSQSSQPAFSVHTVDVHASQQGASSSGHSRVRNETICLEMVSILRRCLGQDCSVRQLLYSNWYSCVKDKPSLHEGILEMLSEHLRKYLSDGEQSLLIDKCVQTTSSGAVLIEPIGYLIYLIGQLLKPTVEIDLENLFGSLDSQENVFVRVKLKRLLADLSKCNLLEQIDMENLRVSEATPESMADCIKVQQLLQVYEALIAHQLLQWSAGNGNADVVYRLYKAHSELLDNTRSPTKAAKKASKLNETQESTRSRKSQASTSQKAPESSKKAPKTRKEKVGAFQPLPCLWDLKMCYRILELLYSEEVAWSSTEQRNSVRGRGVVHRWVARSAKAALRRAHDPAHAHAHLPRIAALLYARCVCRFEDLCDFDDDTAVGCLEMFHACLDMFWLPQYNFNADTFLAKITGIDNVTAAVNKATILAKIRVTLSEVEHADVTQSAEVASKRAAKELASIIVTLLRIPTDFHITLSKEISKLESHVCESQQECGALLGQLLATAAAESCEAALLDRLLARLARVLAAAPDTQTESQLSQGSIPLAWVKESNAQLVLKEACKHILSRLACAKHVQVRVSDLAAALPLGVDADRLRIDKELKETRSSCVLQLCQLAGWVRALCALRGGAAAEHAISLACKLYALAAALVKPLDATAAREARLERLLEVMGNGLTAALRELREHAGSGRGARDGKLVPRLVHDAEAFRAAVYRLARLRADHLDYQKYVSERIAMGMEIREGEGGDETAADEAGDADDTMDLDSDADTVIIAATH